MQVTISPSIAKGSIAAPPSKSFAHRLLTSAGLADGESVIHGVAFSEDISATVDCLTALGASIRTVGDTVFVRGTHPSKFGRNARLVCRECGSTLRFMIPICMTSPEELVLTGSEKLLSRPLGVYSEIAEKHSLKFENSGKEIRVRGRLPGGVYRIPGDISSQFISGLLFALPLVEGDSRIELIPPVASRPYIDMTRSALEHFGIQIRQVGENIFEIPGGQKYLPNEMRVEGDYSNAAFPDAFNLIGGDVEVTGLSPNSLQGDRVYIDSFKQMKRGFCHIDLTDCPDLGPILFVAAALLHGAHFTGTERLRIKESDRVAAMAEELQKCGIILDCGRDCVTVPASLPTKPDVVLSGHNDHRIVMALTVLLSTVGGSISGIEAVRKSYPDFFTVIRQLGIKAETL